MPLAPQTLSVYPNPYLHVDEAGRPCGAFPEDPSHHPGARRWVGAELCARETKPAVRVQGRAANGALVHMETSAAEHERWFEFKLEAVTIPNTEYYRRAVAGRELLAADAATSFACGLGRNHQDPMALLASFKRCAVETHVAHYGEAPDACAAHWPQLDSPQAAPASPTPSKRAAATTEGK